MTQNYQAAQSLKKKTSRKDLKAIQVFTGYFDLPDRVDFDGQANPLPSLSFIFALP